MKRFHFRLERVRRVRSIEVDVARERLQAALARLDEAEQRRGELRASIAEHRVLWKGRLEGAITPVELLTLEAEVERQLASEAAAARRVTTLTADVARATAAWSERRTAERALELLEERRKAEHDLEVRREEARTTDETASLRARNRFQQDTREDR